MMVRESHAARCHMARERGDPLAVRRPLGIARESVADATAPPAAPWIESATSP